MNQYEKWQVTSHTTNLDIIFLQSLYGMNSKSGYAKQYNQSLDRDVSQNKLSMADYFSRKANMLVTLMTGEESDESCTQGTVLLTLGKC